jgi:hypothetical protein
MISILMMNTSKIALFKVCIIVNVYLHQHPFHTKDNICEDIPVTGIQSNQTHWQGDILKGIYHNQK